MLGPRVLGPQLPRGLHRRQALLVGLVGLRLRDVMPFDHRLQHVRASLGRAVGVHEGVVALGVADDSREQRRLAGGELAERLAAHAERRRGIGREEEATCRRLHAVRALPEVHRVEVLLEDLALRVLVVQAIREDELLRLALQILLVAEDPVLDQLLRDRRSALADLALGQVLDEGPRHAADVDARVLPERLVLGVDDRVDEDLRHLGELDRLPVLGAELADLGPVGVEHDRRLGQLAEALHAARVMVRRRDLPGAGNQRGEADPEGQAADQDDGRQPREDTSGVRHGNA